MTSLTEKIHGIHLSDSDLAGLKNQWESTINSPRSLDQVKTMENLVDILWKRDALTTQNAQILFSGVQCLSHNELAIINEYIMYLDREYSDYVVAEALPELVAHEEASCAKSEKCNSSEKSKPADRLGPREAKFYEHKSDIFRYIKENMGLKKFMDFARQKSMQIREAELENMEDRYRSVEERIYQVLKLACERNRRDEFPGIVLRALQAAGHSDIKGDIERKYLE